MIRQGGGWQKRRRNKVSMKKKSKSNQNTAQKMEIKKNLKSEGRRIEEKYLRNFFLSGGITISFE